MFFGYVTKERTCPRCKSPEVYRIRRNGIAVRAVCNVLNVRPHWCANCDNFFLAPRREKAVKVEGPYGVSGSDPSGENRPQAEHVPH
jgi:hypothetical protein